MICSPKAKGVLSAGPHFCTEWWNEKRERMRQIYALVSLRARYVRSGRALSLSQLDLSISVVILYDLKAVHFHMVTYHVTWPKFTFLWCHCTSVKYVKATSSKQGHSMINWCHHDYCQYWSPDDNYLHLCYFLIKFLSNLYRTTTAPYFFMINGPPACEERCCVAYMTTRSSFWQL